MNKTAASLREAIAAAGLRDGMTVSFHHHLRSGDYVINAVMNEIAAMGIKNLTVNASSLFDVHAPLAEHIKNGVITKIITDYMSAGLGEYISGGIMEQPVDFMTHGGRPTAIMLRLMLPLLRRPRRTKRATAREKPVVPPAEASDMLLRMRNMQKRRL